MFQTQPYLTTLQLGRRPHKSHASRNLPGHLDEKMGALRHRLADTKARGLGLVLCLVGSEEREDRDGGVQEFLTCKSTKLQISEITASQIILLSNAK